MICVEENLSNNKRIKSILMWIIVITISTSIIVIGSQESMKKLEIFSGSGDDSVRATVIEIVSSNKKSSSIGEGFEFKDKVTVFRCKVKSGSHKGKIVTASQSQNSAYGRSDRMKTVKKGNEIVISRINRSTRSNVNNNNMESSEQLGTDALSSDQSSKKQEEWIFVDYYRLNKVMALAIVFAVLLVAIGLKKGINALISLVFTALFVFSVFVPWILNGYNIYIGIISTCAFTIIMSLLLIEGASKKSLVTILGCCAGTGMAALITYIMNIFLQLSGLVSENSMYITMLNSKRPIDLVGIVFAGIIIGALGAIMDVAMDISSSLNEIVEHVPNISFGELFKSGMRIGRDIMGTMANTLVLAYIGSSLCDIMLLFTYSSSLIDLLNKEMVIIQILQALAGSISILLTVPLTVILAGIIYLKRGNSKDNTTRVEMVPTETGVLKNDSISAFDNGEEYVPKH